MAKLPVVSGQDAAKAFCKIGYKYSRQKGSHMILRYENPPHRHLSIPNHRSLSKGLLRGLIRDAGLTVEQFINLL